MKKIILFIFLPVLIGCNKNFDNSRIYDLIREKFPNDTFIEKSIEKAKEPVIIPEISLFELDYDPLDFLFENSITQQSFLELHHIYEIQWADKLIAKKLRRRKVFNEVIK